MAADFNQAHRQSPSQESPRTARNASRSDAGGEIASTAKGDKESSKVSSHQSLAIPSALARMPS
jgi:hypothetical protein